MRHSARLLIGIGALAAATLSASPARGVSPDGAAFLARADALIGGKRFDSSPSPHYRVRTDDPRLLPEKAARLLEDFRGFFDGYWKGKIQLRPYDELRPVYLFYSRYHYSQLFGEPWNEGPWTESLYSAPADAIVAHSDAVAGKDLPDILLHEAAHQLVRHRIFGGRTPVPWLDEGLAGYFGNMARNDEGGFVPSEIGEKHHWIFRKGTRHDGKRLARARLRACRAMVRRNLARPIQDLLAPPPQGALPADRSMENDGTSWMLVHFLMHGNRGRHAAAFVRYLDRAARQDVTADGFYKEIGMKPEELQDTFDSYVRNRE